MRSSFPSGGGRREIVIVCPFCQFQSMIPPAAIARNSYFCSSCGKSVDLMSQSFRPTGDGTGSTFSPPRDKGTSKYKSARKGRR